MGTTIPGQPPATADTSTEPVRRSARPALLLFVLSPLIAEYLLGNVSISALGYLVVFAPLYGAGALLVREITRRSGRGWPTMVLLGFAYAVIEEGLVTQTLFNPSYFGFELLGAAHVEALGMGMWWTLFVLTLHTVWSTSVAIAVVEALAVRRRTTPWLGSTGLAVTAVLFALGVAVNTYGTHAQEGFVASPTQLGGAVVVTVAAVVAAFAFRPPHGARDERQAPGPLLVGATALVASSVFMVTVPPEPWGSATDWAVVGLYLAIYAVVITLVVRWSSRSGWDDRHRLALAGGALLTYVWHAFPAAPIVGATGAIDLVGNAVFAAGAVALLAAAAAKVRRAAPAR